MLQERALARGADAGDFLQADSRMSFLRRVRCEPMAKRCASSRSRCTKYSTGSRGFSLNGSRPGTKKVSRPASRSGPLAMATSGTSARPSAASAACAAESCPRPPSMMTRSGQGESACVSLQSCSLSGCPSVGVAAAALPLPVLHGERDGVRGNLRDERSRRAPSPALGPAWASPTALPRKRGERPEFRRSRSPHPRDRSALPLDKRPVARRHRGARHIRRRTNAPPDSLISRLKRRSSTSRIIAKSSPGVRSAERMLNLRYWFFWKPSGPATIMAPTAFVPMMCELS